MTDAPLRCPSRPGAQAELLALVDRLVDEFEAEPAGNIIRSVASVREALLRSGVRQNLTPSVEALVRHRLAARVPA